MLAGMTANESTKIIKAAGGSTAFARLLGIDRQRGYLQRINNWKCRGIPPRVILDHQVTIERLRSIAATAGRR